MTSLITLQQAAKCSLDAAAAAAAAAADVSDDENPEPVHSSDRAEMMAFEASLTDAQSGAALESRRDSPETAGSPTPTFNDYDTDADSESLTDEQVRREIAAREAYIATALQTIHNGRANELDSQEVVQKVERLPMIAYRYSKFYRSKADLKAIGRAFHENDLCGAVDQLWRMKSRGRFRICGSGAGSSAGTLSDSNSSASPPPPPASPSPASQQQQQQQQQPGAALALVYSHLVNALWGATDAFHRLCFDAADRGLYLTLLDDLWSDEFVSHIQANPEQSELVPFIEAYFSVVHNLLQQDDVAEQIIPVLKQRRIAELLKKYLKIKYSISSCN